ncbi:NADP-binding protein [Dacryopinax primogenitus]|uniref:NADP-binding protein n=1 Tax=Dacryopinax primogenitus (strain DJM 731) TaxID=1858805 RepID=M5FVI1_DACPD|nr:NADP-binding protein [Dacryopinax primogenitus]EJT97341.1 NADP-binding protein [Dacryopinax primogenitus]
MDYGIPPLPPNTSLASRSFLITGATSGLGYATALMALQLGASPVYITARDVSKGTSTRDSLLADPVVKENNPNAKVEVYALDMARWEGVLGFADKFIDDRTASGEGLDIAILNAGMFSIEYELAPTGNEMSIQVNHLSTSLLALLLLPLLEKSSTPDHTSRLTFITSVQHMTKYGRLTACPPDNVNYLESLNDKATFDRTQRYGVSKTLLIYIVQHLATHVSPDKVIINNLCPGAIYTSINRNMPIHSWPLLAWMWRHGNTPEAGARTYIQAVAVLGKESHGKWYQRGKHRKYGDFVRGLEGQKMREKEWKETMEVLEKVRPGISQVVA